MTVEEVAMYLSVGKPVVRSLLRNKKLKGKKIGGQWRITKEALMRLLEDDLGRRVQGECGDSNKANYTSRIFPI